MELVNENYKSIWNAALGLIQPKINDNQVFSNFFFETNIVKMDKDLITVSAPNSFAAQILTRKYLELITECLYQVTSSNFRVEIIDINQFEEKLENKLLVMKVAELSREVLVQVNQEHLADSLFQLANAQYQA